MVRVTGTLKKLYSAWTVGTATIINATTIIDAKATLKIFIVTVDSCSCNAMELRLSIKIVTAEVTAINLPSTTKILQFLDFWMETVVLSRQKRAVF